MSYERFHGRQHLSCNSEPHIQQLAAVEFPSILRLFNNHDHVRDTRQKRSHVLEKLGQLAATVLQWHLVSERYHHRNPTVHWCLWRLADIANRPWQAKGSVCAPRFAKASRAAELHPPAPRANELRICSSASSTRSAISAIAMAHFT